MPPLCPGLAGLLFVVWGRFFGSCLEVSTSALASFTDYSLMIPLRSPAPLHAPLTHRSEVGRLGISRCEGCTLDAG